MAKGEKENHNLNYLKQKSQVQNFFIKALKKDKEFYNSIENKELLNKISFDEKYFNEKLPEL